MKSLKTSIFMVLALLIFSGQTEAASVSSSLQIQATVPASMQFRIEKQKHSLTVTKSDLRKGTKKVDNGTVISVSTNSASGYVISVSPQPLSAQAAQNETGIYSAVTVSVDGRTYSIAPGGHAEIRMPPIVNTKKKTIRFNYRFTLSPGAGPGSYPWPVLITVFPL